MDYLTALREAAQAKGGPLTDAERAECLKRSQQPNREELYARFEKVIRMAGYKYPAVQSILDEYFEQYMKEDIGEFIAMLESYERSHGDPD